MDLGWGVPLAGRRSEVLLLSLSLILGLYHLSLCAGLTSTYLPLQGKPASQSSTVTAAPSGVPLTADLAIDGDTTTNFFSLSCSHTHADEHPWWIVDLQATHCLGKVTLVNRGDSSYERLTGAVVRAGVNAHLFENAGCGSPVTPAQASVPGGQVSFLCDPPVAARYVSVDIDQSQPGVVIESGGIYLQLCEVMVEEYPMVECQPTPTYIMGNRSSCEFKLFWEGACVTEPRPLASIITQSLMPCSIKCKRDGRCWSFDYNLASGRCSLYDVRAENLKTASEPGCVVYAVVSFKVGANYNGVCKSSALY